MLKPKTLCPTVYCATLNKIPGETACLLSKEHNLSSLNMFLESLHGKKNNIIFWDNIYSLLQGSSSVLIIYDMFNLI